MVAYTCNPRSRAQEAEAGGLKVQEFKASLDYSATERPRLSQKPETHRERARNQEKTAHERERERGREREHPLNSLWQPVAFQQYLPSSSISEF
jgi:hypothetical protein